MKRHFLLTPPRWLLLTVAALQAAAHADETGSIRGRMPLGATVIPIALEKYTGKISGKVQAPPRRVGGAWLEAPGLRAHRPTDSAAVEQRGYQFTSGLLIVPLGTRVAFPNLDPDYHNVFSLSKAKRFDLGRYKADEKPAPVVTFDKPGIVPLYCEIHEHMRGTLIVVDTPYFTRTSEDGSFALTGIPPGRYTLKAAVDEKRAWEQPITISARQTLEVNLSAR